MSLSTIVEAGAGTQWVDISVVAAIDPDKYFTFADGTIDGTDDLGVLEMFTDTEAYVYSFQEDSATEGTLLVNLPDDGDWSLVPVAEYVFDRVAGTLTFTDVEGLETETFGTDKIYAVDRTADLPSFTDGTYSYTDGSGREIAAGSDNEKGSIVVDSNAPADFSDSASIFGDLAGQSTVTISWLGDTLYGTIGGGDTVLLGSLGEVEADRFSLGENTFELRDVPDELTGGGSNTDGIWAPKNASGNALSGNANGKFTNLKFDDTGELSFDTTSITDADVDPLDGVTAGAFYVLGGELLYAGTEGEEELVATYAIEEDKLTFTNFEVGKSYGTYTNGTVPDGGGDIDYFE
ncbi:MAG: hypothetical protein LBR93_07710 [Treponema sp.]|nr:hypothetical protein [Treponema sp.]